MKKIEIDLSQFGIEVMADIRFDQNYAAMGQELVARFRAFIASENQPDFELSLPANWFEALKEAHAPKWILKRWPVKTEVKKFPVKAYYPHLRTKIPRELRGDRFMIAIAEHPPISMITDGECSAYENRLHFFDAVKSEKMFFHDPKSKCPCCGKVWIP